MAASAPGPTCWRDCGWPAELRHPALLSVRVPWLNMRSEGHGRILCRRGHGAVEWTPTFPGLHQPLGMLRGNAPHLEVHPNGIEDGQIAWTLVGITIGFDTYVHPLQGDMV